MQEINLSFLYKDSMENTWHVASIWLVFAQCPLIMMSFEQLLTRMENHWSALSSNRILPKQELKIQMPAKLYAGELTRYE